MATKMFNEGLKQLALIDWESATIKALLLMTNTTADTQNDGIAAIGDFTTLDEADGSGYARVTITGALVTKEDGSDRAKLTCDDIEFPTLGDGTRDIQGVLICYDDGGTLRPISWHEFAVARAADGSDFLVEIRADTGLILLTMP